MSDKHDRAGLGKVIYSDSDKDAQDANPAVEDQDDRAEVEEADVESFPASDPPSFAGGTQTEDT